MITNCMTNAARAALLESIKKDTFKIALYTAAANLGPKTAEYTAVGEVEGQGYTAGGAVLSGAKVTDSGSYACLTFDEATWPNVTIVARGALVYNATRGRIAIAVLDFGADHQARLGPFTVEIPKDLIRLGTQ
jgi:hypothetical protein